MNKFITRCACGGLTSKSYARANGGKCKACATGIAPQPKAPATPTMPCGQCGAKAKADYEPAFQEYPGASVQGGYWAYQCACGHSDTVTDMRGYSIRENTRGW